MDYKLFSHRGFLESKIILKENTIKSFQNAIDNHFDAIELDIWLWDDKIILNHDSPNKEASHYDSLEELFEKFGNNITYWLDFKNITEENCEIISEKLSAIIKKQKIALKNLILVPYLENSDLKDNIFAYKSLRKYCGTNCNIGAFIRKIHKSKLESYYQEMVRNNIKNLSVQFKNIDSNFMNIFKNINILAWTVNKKKDLEYLAKLKIKNFATDQIKPQCKQRKNHTI